MSDALALLLTGLTVASLPYSAIWCHWQYTKIKWGLSPTGKTRVDVQRTFIPIYRGTGHWIERKVVQHEWKAAEGFTVWR